MDKHIIKVGLDERSYDIAVHPGSLSDAGTILKPFIENKNCLIITDSNVQKLYAEKLISAISPVVTQVNIVSFPAGEENKTLQTYEMLLHACVEYKLDRSSIIIALGGGVTGDLAGFTAASYMRGIPFIQCPTSLLAMVDSSVGGKTGVDLPSGKNLVGAFWQPKAVLIDPELLKTLPEKELKCGLGEIVKHAMILDPKLFETLSSNVEKLNHLDLPFYSQIVARNCEIKADVVQQDEREGGIRAILNYGHTFAHALESVSNYAALGHGEAVAIGMAMAGDLAVSLGMLSQENAEKQNELMSALHLPITINDMDPQAVLEAMSKDKKNEAGKLRFVLASDIGSVSIEKGIDTTLVLDGIKGRII